MKTIINKQKYVQKLNAFLHVASQTTGIVTDTSSARLDS